MSANGLGLNISLPSGSLSQLQERSTSQKRPNQPPRLVNISYGGVEHNNEEQKAQRSCSICSDDDDDGEHSTLQNDGHFENQNWRSSYGEEEGSDNDESCAENNSLPRSDGIIDEEDRVIMTFVPSDSDDTNGNHDGEHSHEGEDYSGNEDDDDDDDNDSEQSEQCDDLSLSPPPSMPLLVVELEKLCGYAPTDEPESQRLADELCIALLGSKIDNHLEQGAHCNNNGTEVTNLEKETQLECELVPNSNNNDMTYGDGISLDFTTRAVELLEAGVARHSDTMQRQEIINADNEQNKLNFAFVPYPEYMPLPTRGSDGDSDEPCIISTAKVWKWILHPHEIDVVDRLLKLLSKCSRDLMWKYEMATEIRRIAKDEKQFQERQIREQELKVWRREKRPDELAKLYDVREAFELKLEIVRKKYEGYVSEREERVQRELQRRKEKGIGSGGIAGLDWDGKVTFAFDDDVEIILQKILLEQQQGKLDSMFVDDDGYCESANDEFDDYNEHDDEHSCGSGGINDGDNKNFDNKHLEQAQTLGNDSLHERKKRRAKAASKRMRRRLEAEREKEREEELRLKIKNAHEEEEQVRAMCMSTDEKLAMVMVQNLEQRLEKVDELLDSLQTDVWNDEEEGLLDGDLSDDDILDETESGEMTLLDSILAMILGAIPPPKDISVQNHFSFLKEEHRSIVDDWKKIFGRMPRLQEKGATAKNPQKQQCRKEYSDQDFSVSSCKSDDDEVIETSQHFKMDLMRSIPDDWENEADCDEDPGKDYTKAPCTNSIVSKSNQGPSKTGLRPGGRMI